MRSMYDEDRSEIMIVQFLAEHLESHGFQAFQVGTYAPVLSCEDKKKPTLSFSSKRATRSFSSKWKNGPTRISKVRRHLWVGKVLLSLPIHYGSTNTESQRRRLIRLNSYIWRINGKHQYHVCDFRGQVGPVTTDNHRRCEWGSQDREYLSDQGDVH